METLVFLRQSALTKKGKHWYNGLTSSEKTEASPPIDAPPPPPPSPPSESASLGLLQGVGQEGWSAAHDDDVMQLYTSVSKRTVLYTVRALPSTLAHLQKLPGTSPSQHSTAIEGGWTSPTTGNDGHVRQACRTSAATA